MGFTVGTEISWSSLVDLVKRKEDRGNAYDVYGEGVNFAKGDVCFVGRPMEVSDDDEEIYPCEVVDRGLHFIVSADHLQDVVDNAISQNVDVSTDVVIDAIKHFSEYDDFMDVD